jgi:hypothetical protein
MAQPDQQLLGFTSQAQPSHHRKPSDDSAVDFSSKVQRLPAFATHVQMPNSLMAYHNPSFMSRGIQAHDRGQGPFHIPVPMTIAGAASTGMDATLLGNHPRALDQQGGRRYIRTGVTNIVNMMSWSKGPGAMTIWWRRATETITGTDYQEPREESCSCKVQSMRQL